MLWFPSSDPGGTEREWPSNFGSDIPTFLLHKDQPWYHVGRDCTKEQVVRGRDDWGLS